MRIPLSGYIFTWVGYEERKTYCSKFSAIQWGDSGYWYRVFQVWKCWKKSKTSIACGQCQDATNSIHNVQRYVNKFFVYAKFPEVIESFAHQYNTFFFFFHYLKNYFTILISTTTNLLHVYYVNIASYESLERIKILL